MKAEFTLTFSTEDDINEVLDVFTELVDAWHYANGLAAPEAVATEAASAEAKRRQVPLDVQPVLAANGLHARPDVQARPVGPNEYQDAAGRRFLRIDR